MPAFRVHFEKGEPVTVNAADPAAARKAELSLRDGIVTKIKIVRETVNAA